MRLRGLRSAGKKNPAKRGFNSLSRHRSAADGQISRPECPALRGPSRNCGTNASVRVSEHSRHALKSGLARSVPIATARVSSIEALQKPWMSDFCRTHSHCGNCQRLYLQLAKKNIADQRIVTHCVSNLRRSSQFLPWPLWQGSNDSQRCRRAGSNTSGVGLDFQDYV